MFATSSSSVTVPTLVVPHSSTVPPLSTSKTPHNSSNPIINRRHLLTISISISVTTPFTQPNSLSPPVADARGLFQMPPFRLTNRYFLVRAGESEYESLGIINTNPVAKTSMDSGLSEKGKKQIVRAAFELKAMGACEKGCWIWPSITQRAYQAAEIIASVNGVSRSYIVPEYSFLDARGLGAYEGKNLESVSEVYASDGISTTIKPPPIDDGTPNESVADVFVRVTQLMSILETQYSGDTVIIVSPDSDNLTILQAGLVGLDLRRHRDLSFAPGEVRFVDTKSIPTYKQPASAVYKCYNPPNLHGIWFILLSCHCSSKIRGSETCYLDLNFLWTILFTSLWQLAVSISPMNLFRARNAGPSCLVWNLWRERNRRMIDDQELFMENFKSEFVELLFYWMLFFDVSRPPMVFSFRKSLHCYLISLILITWYMF